MLTEHETIIANLKAAVTCGELTRWEAADILSDIEDHALKAKCEKVAENAENI